MLTLPKHHTHLSNCNFLTRVLYTNIVIEFLLSSSFIASWTIIVFLALCQVFIKPTWHGNMILYGLQFGNMFRVNFAMFLIVALTCVLMSMEVEGQSTVDDQSKLCDSTSSLSEQVEDIMIILKRLENVIGSTQANGQSSGDVKTSTRLCSCVWVNNRSLLIYFSLYTYIFYFPHFSIHNIDFESHYCGKLLC